MAAPPPPLVMAGKQASSILYSLFTLPPAESKQISDNCITPAPPRPPNNFQTRYTHPCTPHTLTQHHSHSHHPPSHLCPLTKHPLITHPLTTHPLVSDYQTSSHEHPLGAGRRRVAEDGQADLRASSRRRFSPGPDRAPHEKTRYE